MRKIEKSLLILQSIIILITMAAHLLSWLWINNDAGDVGLAGHITAFATGFVCCGIKLFLIKRDCKGDKGTDREWSVYRALDIVMTAVYLAVYTFKSVFTFLFPFGIIISRISTKADRSEFFLRISIVLIFLSFLLNLFMAPPMDINDVSQFLVILISIYLGSKLNISVLSMQAENLRQLSATNDTLNRKVAEFFNLQHLQSAIRTIHNTEELLKTVNDMIIGIVGPTYSSIVLYEKDNDGAEGRFVLAATNIKPEHTKDFLEHDCPMLWAINNEDGVVSDVGNGIYFKDEKIASYIVMPLMINTERVGMIVIAQYLQSGLNSEHLRLIRYIAGDLSVALANTGLYEKMEKMATMDGLTLVYNRMFFKTALEQEFEKARGNYPLSIAICDADLFKSINDRYGHIFGDYVLKCIADRLKSKIRSNDIIARYGGEEFVIILPNCPLKAAYRIVDRLRESICSEPIKDKNNSIYVTVSFGVATYPDHGTTSSAVLIAADNALYAAKRDGRNCTRHA